MPIVFLCQSISCWVVSTHAPSALRSRCCSWPDSRSSRSLRHSVMSCSRRWMKSSQTDMRKRLSYNYRLSLIAVRSTIHPLAGLVLPTGPALPIWTRTSGAPEDRRTAGISVPPPRVYVRVGSEAERLTASKCCPLYPESGYRPARRACPPSARS